MSSDQQFDDYLKQQADLSNIYRQGASEAPPGELDARILAASRRPVPQQSKSALGEILIGLFHTKYWPAATALAAVVLVTLTVNMQMPVSEPGNKLTAPAGKEQEIQTTESLDVARQPSPQAPVIPQPQAPETIETARQSPPQAPAMPQPQVTQLQKARIQRADFKAPAGKAITDQAGPESAEVWLQKIEQQLRDGRQQEARKLFYAFRELYPDKKIPDDLIARLGM